jgi:hypothetical protein
VKILDKLKAIPERIYVLAFLAIFLIAAVSTYFLKQDTRLVEKQILLKQKDLSSVIRLKEAYETKKRVYDKTASKKTEVQTVSLGLVEEMVKKNFVGGNLAMLQPGSAKEEKGPQQMVVELRITGAPLGEIVAFVKAVQNSGLYVGKMRLSLPAANPTTLDMQATIMEKHSHG